MTLLSSTRQNSQALLQHTNNQDPHIQFTVEPPQQGSLPFLDTLVTIEQDNTFSTSVYRKLTHTDQYLHWDSNLHITAKQSVFNTLAHRAKVVSSSQDKLDRELSTSRQHYNNASIQIGPSTNGTTSLSTQANLTTVTKLTTTTNKTTTPTKGTLL